MDDALIKTVTGHWFGIPVPVDVYQDRIAVHVTNDDGKVAKVVWDRDKLTPHLAGWIDEAQAERCQLKS